MIYYSRPRVRNLNVQVVLLFRIGKDCQGYPYPAFADLAEQCEWVLQFVH